MIGSSARWQRLVKEIEAVAASESTVLVVGETGTGKELVARALHARSPRRDRPLVKVNCGAISAGLVESELFGHSKGAFTGALQNASGVSNSPTAARSSSMRSESFPSTPKSNCSGRCRSTNSSPLEAMRPSG